MELIDLNNEVPKSQELEYQRLLSEYEKLDQVTKEAIILYKSSLFLFMSKIMKIPNYNQIPIDILYSQIKDEDLAELITLQEAIFEKRSIAKTQSKTFPFLTRIIEEYQSNKENALKELLKQLAPYCQILEKAFTQLTLEEDMTVYRGTKGTEEGSLSDNTIISNTLYKDIAFSFADDGKDENYNIGKIYELKIKKGTNVLVCPVGFDKGAPIKSQQFEIMLLKENAIYLGNQTRLKTYYFKGNTPLTIDYAKGVVFPKDYDYDDQEIAEEIVAVTPDIDIESLKKQIQGISLQRNEETTEKRR